MFEEEEFYNSAIKIQEEKYVTQAEFGFPAKTNPGWLDWYHSGKNEEVLQDYKVLGIRVSHVSDHNNDERIVFSGLIEKVLELRKYILLGPINDHYLTFS